MPSGSAGVEVAEPVVIDESGETNISIDESEPSQNTVVTKPRFYTARLDIRFGKVGETEVIEGVRVFDFLPDEQFALASYIGTSEDATTAVFAISTNVAETTGEGSCAPSDAPGCQFLTLSEGEERQLVAVDGETYRLKLVEIDVVAVPDPREK